MNKRLILFSILIVTLNSFGQNKKDLENIEPIDTNYSNISVSKIDSDELVSNFIIWVKDEVKGHKHLKHSETIVVIEGEGIMSLNEEQIEIKKGDYIFIPKNTIHSVKVTSDIPLKVLSIQAPEFKGEDRIWIEK